VLGSKVDLPQEEGEEPLIDDKGLLLKTDFTTLRQCQMHQSQAFVFADPYSLNQHLYPFSPRNVLKRFVTEASLPKPMNLRMNFTVNFQKTNTKDD
jgi:glutamine synthetase